MLRHPAHRRRPRHDDRGRRRRRRRLAGLRQHALRAARRSSTPTRSGPASPTGRTSSRPTTTRPSGCSASSRTRCAPRPTTSWRRSPTTWASATPSTRPRSASSSAAPRPGPARRSADPFFGGEGPERNACLNCGECMSGCRHNAKNTLVKNYLYLAEKRGAQVLPLTTVTRVEPAAAAAATTSTCSYTKARRAHRGRHAGCSPPSTWSSPLRPWAPRSCCTG